MPRKGEKTASTLLYEMVKRSWILERPISNAQMARADRIREEYDDRSLNLAPSRRKRPTRAKKRGRR